MAFFDAGKNWVIRAPAPEPPVKRAAEDLRYCVGFLGGKSAPELVFDRDADTGGAGSGGGDSPVIVLKNGSGGRAGREFSWRASPCRIEIAGQGAGGLCKGIYDFLAALGITWPEPDSRAIVNNAGSGKIFPLAADENVFLDNPPDNVPGDEAGALASQKRLVIPENSKILKVSKRRTAVFQWAIRSGFDAVIFPFHVPPEAAEEALSFGLLPETGGWVMSLMIPRRLFLFHRELFRMEGGKRLPKIHFCPTNPDTIAALRVECEKLFRSAGKIPVFHVWPQKGEERTWCSCPACRAFTFAEQNRIAINAASDALARVNPKAFLSYYEDAAEEPEIPLRPNVFRIDPEKVVALNRTGK